MLMHWSLGFSFWEIQQIKLVGGKLIFPCITPTEVEPALNRML